MRAGRMVVAVVVATLGLAAPAVAHDTGLGASWLMGEDHTGWYWPSSESKSSNFELIGRVERTKPATTYRNSDLAFWGRFAFAGHYEGFQIIDTSDARAPEQVVDFDCPGSQHDVSVWQNLLFVSVETPCSSPA